MSPFGTLSKLPAELLHQVLDVVAVDPYNLYHHTRILPLGEGRGFQLPTAPSVPRQFTQDKLDIPACVSRAAGENGSIIPRNALASLCLVSRPLNGLATPRLYRVLSEYQTEGRGMLIVRTLREREDLAGLVRSVVLQDPDLKFGEEDGAKKQVAAWYAEEEAMMDGSGEDEDGDEKTATTPAAPPGGAMLANLIIHLCPNLESLECLAYWVDSDEWDGQEGLYPLVQPSSLRKLRRLTVSHWDTEMGCALWDVRPLVDAAPNLGEIFLNQATGGWDGEDDRFTKLKKVKRLEVTNSAMDKGGFVSLLKLCPNLEEIKYECGGAVVGDEQFTPQEAAEGVLEYGEKVQVFELDLIQWEFTGEFSQEDMAEANIMLEARGVNCRFTVDYDRDTQEAVWL